MPRSETPSSQQPPRALDLFCGAGGFTCGFEQNGWNVVAGVDNDEDALATYEKNTDALAIKADLSQADPSAVLSEHDISPESIDVITGGPPCQAFSTAGERDTDDPRAALADNYYDWIDTVRPRGFLMENVTGILSMDNGEVIDRLVSRAESYGYSVAHKTLNAADFGVPQKRKRVFVQGRLDGQVAWPEPTHAPPSKVENQHALGDFA